MSGQDATKSIKEVKAQIERTCCGGNDQGSMKKDSKMGSSEMSTMKKMKHQG